MRDGAGTRESASSQKSKSLGFTWLPTALGPEMPGTPWESSLEPLKLRSTKILPGKSKSSQTRPGNVWSSTDPTTAQTVRILLFKSTAPSSLDPDLGVSAPQRARARAGGRGGQDCTLEREGQARDAVSHLGLVAEEAKSEAAAFELHLQR